MLGIFSSVIKTATRQDRWAGYDSTASLEERGLRHEQRKAQELREQMRQRSRVWY